MNKLPSVALLMLLIVSPLFLSKSAQAAAPDSYIEQLNPLLQRYAKPDGVAYQAWHENAADRAALKQLREAMADYPVSKVSPPQRKAFYINLYNVAMLDIVLENYPLKTVTTILPDFGIFKSKQIRLGDKMLSLDDVEKGTLLKEFPDARIHFAVNCASVSCPPLATTAFEATQLDAQLDAVTRAFAASSHAAQVDRKAKKVRYSSLFNWYAADFGVDNPAHYLNRYRATALPTNFATGYIDYDWALNSAAQ